MAMGPVRVSEQPFSQGSWLTHLFPVSPQAWEGVLNLRSQVSPDPAQLSLYIPIFFSQSSS
jgi:hypothetical protein